MQLVDSDRGRTAQRIWTRLDRRSSAALFELQRSRISTVVGAITMHYNIGTNARCIGLGRLANDFYRNCGNEEEDETILYLPALGRRRKRHIGVYYM